MSVAPYPTPVAQATQAALSSTPDHCTLTDRELVLRILASPRRRIAVELLVLEMELAERRENNHMQFQITVAGRRIAVVPQGRVREVLLPKE